MNWTRTPPKIIPKAPPIGAPAAKVAKATLLIFDGGNECASIPRAEGTVADAPMPWRPLRTSSVISSNKNE